MTKTLRYRVYIRDAFIGEYDASDLLTSFGRSSTYEDVGDEVHIRHPANREQVIIARPIRPPFTIELRGWVHVYTWRESHGDHVTEIYQQEIDPDHIKVNLLEVTKYRDDRLDRVSTENGQFAHNYLLARWVREQTVKDSSNWSMEEESVSPCYTSGTKTWYNKVSDRIYRLVSVAGHGEWATDEGEAGKRI